jgi:hypothetical protein
VVREQFVRYVSKLAAPKMHPTQRFPTDIAVIFASTGIVELLAWWLRQKKRLPIEMISDIFEHFVIAPMFNNNAISVCSRAIAGESDRRYRGH